jgi:3-oxoacyl-[acyl-carrier protein] reductase
VTVPNLSYDYSGKSVIVTGAARGVGLAIATKFAHAGAAVYLVDIDEQELTAAAAGIDGMPLPTDVADSEQVNRTVETVVAREGRLDIIVNNAGILRDQLVWKLTDDQWHAVVDVHLGGTFRFTRAAVPHLRQAGGGRIINVTSYTGLHGNAGQANYAAAKGGIVAFTKTTAKELARFGITVNAISPNADTRMIESIPADLRERIEATIPMGRFAAPSEMTGAVMFLASQEAGYITGTVLPVEGGLAM